MTVWAFVILCIQMNETTNKEMKMKTTMITRYGKQIMVIETSKIKVRTAIDVAKSMGWTFMRCFNSGSHIEIYFCA